MAHPFELVTIGAMRRIRFLLVICVTLAVALAAESAGGGPLVAITVSPTLPPAGSGTPGPGMFLVARRALDDSHFGQSVVYLVQHGDEGSMGLIVNRSSDSSLSDAVPDLEHVRAVTHILRYGGPVGLSVILMLVRSESVTRGMAHVADDVYISSDRSVIERELAAKTPASEVRFYIGHSGWTAGQLDFELERGSWYVVAADADAIFSADPDSVWERLIERLEPAGIQVENRPLSPPAPIREHESRLPLIVGSRYARGE